jgi:hypothetical protein
MRPSVCTSRGTVFLLHMAPQHLHGLCPRFVSKEKYLLLCVCTYMCKCTCLCMFVCISPSLFMLLYSPPSLFSLACSLTHLLLVVVIAFVLFAILDMRPSTLLWTTPSSVRKNGNATTQRRGARGLVVAVVVAAAAAAAVARVLVILWVSLQEETPVLHREAVVPRAVVPVAVRPGLRRPLVSRLSWHRSVESGRVCHRWPTCTRSSHR